MSPFIIGPREPRVTRICNTVTYDDFIFGDGPTGETVETTDSKSSFVFHVGMGRPGPQNQALFRAIMDEARAGRDRLFRDRGSLVPEFRNDTQIQPPYRPEQISEVAFSQQLQYIYDHASPRTRLIYEMVRSPLPGFDFWAIRWALARAIEGKPDEEGDEEWYRDGGSRPSSSTLAMSRSESCSKVDEDCGRSALPTPPTRSASVDDSKSLPPSPKNPCPSKLPPLASISRFDDAEPVVRNTQDLQHHDGYMTASISPCLSGATKDARSAQQPSRGNPPSMLNIETSNLPKGSKAQQGLDGRMHPSGVVALGSSQVKILFAEGAGWQTSLRGSGAEVEEIGHPTAMTRSSQKRKRDNTPEAHNYVPRPAPLERQGPKLPTPGTAPPRRNYWAHVLNS